MGRKYTIPIPRTAVSTGPIDLIQLVVPSNKVMILRQGRITQSSDAGDAESEQIQITPYRGIGATIGSAGAAAVLRLHDPGDAAAAITATVFNTTVAIAGAGTLLDLFNEDENIHNGWYHAPPPDERYLFGGTDILVVRLEAAPDDPLTIGGFVVVEELG